MKINEGGRVILCFKMNKMKYSKNTQILDNANWTISLMEQFLQEHKKNKKIGFLKVVSENEITVFSSKEFTSHITDLYLDRVEFKRIQSYMKDFCFRVYKIMPKIEKLAETPIANEHLATQEIKRWGSEEEAELPTDVFELNDKLELNENFSKIIKVEDMMQYCSAIYNYVNNKYFRLIPKSKSADDDISAKKVKDDINTLSGNILQELEENYLKTKVPKLNWTGSLKQFLNLIHELRKLKLVTDDRNHLEKFIKTCLTIKGEPASKNKDLSGEISRTFSGNYKSSKGNRISIELK